MVSMSSDQPPVRAPLPWRSGRRPGRTGSRSRSGSFRRRSTRRSRRGPTGAGASNATGVTVPTIGPKMPLHQVVRTGRGFIVQGDTSPVAHVAVAARGVVEHERLLALRPDEQNFDVGRVGVVDPFKRTSTSVHRPLEPGRADRRGVAIGGPCPTGSCGHHDRVAVGVARRSRSVVTLPIRLPVASCEPDVGVRSHGDAGRAGAGHELGDRPGGGRSARSGWRWTR